MNCKGCIERDAEIRRLITEAGCHNATVRGLLDGQEARIKRIKRTAREWREMADDLQTQLDDANTKIRLLRQDCEHFKTERTEALNRAMNLRASLIESADWPTTGRSQRCADAAGEPIP